MLSTARLSAPTSPVQDPLGVLAGDLVRPGDHVVVVGTGDGSAIARLAGLVGRGGRVHVLDPSPMAAPIALMAPAAEHAGRVTFQQGAVGTSSGDVEATVPSRWRVGFIGRAPRVAASGWMVVRVHALTLDDWAERAAASPSLVVLDRRVASADVLGGALRLVSGRATAWLVCSSTTKATRRQLTEAGHRLFSPWTYVPLAEDDEEAGGLVSGLLAVPSGRGTRHRRRWQRAPDVRAFAELPLGPSASAHGRRAQTDYTFLPAGRWLATATIELEDDQRCRTRIVDTEGRTIARGVEVSRRVPGTARHALALDLAADTACRCLATSTDPTRSLSRGEIAIAEVRFR